MRASPSGASASCTCRTAVSSPTTAPARMRPPRRLRCVRADGRGRVEVTAPPRRIYGRRRGRPLRPGRQQLKDTLLPQLAVALPETGLLDPRTLFAEPPASVWLEIGFGAGEHLATQAEEH